jgi:amino acid adenylation domain-containing protein
LNGVLLSDHDLFEAETLARLRRQFLIFLAHVAASADRPLHLASLMTAAERHQVVALWNDTHRELPDRRIEALFEEVVRRMPDAAAIIDADGTTTYAELDDMAERIAGHLETAGATTGRIVAIIADRSRATVAALLAVLKVGAAYMMLDPRQPRERLLAMVSETQPVTLLTLERDAPEFGIPVLDIRTLFAGPGRRDRRPSPAGAHGLALVVYTSGSTGRPKGILIPHQPIVRLMHDQNYLTVRPGDRVAHISSLAFDAATFELWAPLLNGATMVVVSHETALETERLIALLHEQAVTAAFLTTALFNQVVDTDPLAFSTLDTVMFGGEACDSKRVSMVLARPPRRLLNVYGPSESTTFASYWEAKQPSQTVPIGRPITHTELYVLDRAGQPVPPGSAGELFIGGAGLAWGYLANPALTAERFVPDSVSGRPGRRLYRTGDRVRLLANGAVDFLGRFDRQVKIRGFRIEPGDVEASLLALPNVREAAVIVREGASGERRLVAFVGVSDSLVTVEELRAGLRDSLPDYMRPAEIGVLHSLPLNTSGKIDRDALSSLTIAATKPGSRRAGDQVEAEVAHIVADLLERDEVAPDNDFFELGGHSITATRLAARLRTVFGVDIDLASIFEYPQIAAIARMVANALASAAPAAMPSIGRLKIHGAAPLSFAQSRLWFLDRMGLTGSAYHSPVSLRLRGKLDERAIEAALNALVERHEPLRTIFEEIDGTPRQIVVADTTAQVACIDLALLSGDEQDAALRRAVANAEQQPFDLTRNLPIRFLLVHLGPADWVLTLVFHHIAFDGWSLPIVARELAEFYNAICERRPVVLPPLPIRYVDFAMWQREWLEGPATADLLAKWRRRLERVPALDLATDFERKAVQTHEGGLLSIAWPRDLADRLLGLARRRRSTLFMLLLAGFKALLHRYTGQQQIVVGSPVANRTLEEVQGLVGFFVNSLVLATDFSGDPTFEELLARVRETTLEAYAHQDLPFEKLVEDLQPGRDLSRHPLFQTVFVLQQSDAMLPNFRFQGIEGELLNLGEVAVRFDLEAHLFLAPDGLRGYLFYNRDLFLPETIERLERHFRVLLENAAQDPTQRISSLSLLSPEEDAAMKDWSHA